MQQQITRGDYLKDLITIYIENNLQQDLDELYSQFVFQCGEIQKLLTPAQVIKISFTEQESQLLTNYNTCYLAGITSDGHKETFNGSISFNTRGEVVYYEPTPNSSLQASTTSTIACPCTGITGVFANCTQPAIKAYFSINYVPTKLSELQNDTDFVDSVDLSDAVAEHNASESAHPYIQSALASATEALTVSIQAEETARIEAVSLAISTTEAYTDSVLQSATTAINTTIGDLSQLDTSVKSSITNAINAEVSARQGADNNLQGQIDALAAASDVTDIVGTYAELQSYDTQHLNNNDIIKVLSDETHDDEPSYYRFNKTAGTFSYIGSESAAYTKAQSDSIFVTQTTTVNNKPLSSDITLTASDVSALPASTTITNLASTTQMDAINSGATTAKINQIATNTTAIATNTSAISTINGKIPTDASTTNKLVSASTLAASIANFANKDLNNLTDNGEARLHALKAYADEGELLQDSDGLVFVKKYAHSTFDLSKFTVVGSPTITNDGIASGFSESDYLKTIQFQPKDKHWKIECCFTTPQSFGVWKSIFSKQGDYNLTCNLSDSGFIQYAFSSNGTSANIGFRESNILQTNTKYYIKLEFTGTSYNGYLSTDGINYTSISTPIESSTPILDNANYLNIGIGRGLANPWNDSIDLKQLSITVDGVEVFSGNKTGIDTIKPSNFTAITSSASSPFVNPVLPFSDNGLTISADGIASGFTTSNYLKTTAINIQSTSAFEFDVKINTGLLGSSDIQDIFSTANLNVFRLLINSNKLRIITDAGTTTKDSIAFIQQNTDYYIKAKLNNVNKTMNVSYSLDGINYTTAIDDTYSSALVYNDVFGIGIELGGVTRPFTYGSLDLNAFKIYVDGDLVYQPCLKIPYTESKTGSKIVDSIYRDRVADMSAQFGYANYYTLSNTDFTLPQVELYGLIEKLSNRPDYDSVITVSDINGSSKAYTIGSKCLGIIKPSTPASTYTISVQPAYGSAYKSISGYGYMTLEFDTGDKVYASVASSMDIYLIR